MLRHRMSVLGNGNISAVIHLAAIHQQRENDSEFFVVGYTEVVDILNHVIHIVMTVN